MASFMSNVQKGSISMGGLGPKRSFATVNPLHIARNPRVLRCIAHFSFENKKRHWIRIYQMCRKGPSSSDVSVLKDHLPWCSDCALKVIREGLDV